MKDPKNIVIVTNFGCKKKCKACLFNLLPDLQFNEKPDIDWGGLEAAILTSNADSEYIKVCGGDPFFKWEKHLDFFNKLSEIAREINKEIMVYSPTIPFDTGLLKKIGKIAYLIDYKNEDSIKRVCKAYWWLKDTVKIRIVQEVDKDMKDSDVFNLISELQKFNIKEITFKESFANKKDSYNYHALKSFIPTMDNIKWVDDKDVNEYFFLSDNSLHEYLVGDSELLRESWKQSIESINDEEIN